MNAARKLKLIIALVLTPIGLILCQQRYQYPLNPQMQEWRSMSVEQKTKLLQIPQDVLSTLSSETLVAAYLDSPFCSLIIAYSRRVDGFRRVYREFNGVRALLARADAGSSIIYYYSKMKVDGYDRNWGAKEKGAFTFRFVYLESLLGQPEVLAQLSRDNAKDLARLLLSKYRDKSQHVSEHSIVGLESCCYTLALVLNHCDALVTIGAPTDPEMQSFLDTGYAPSGKVLNMVLEKAMTFVEM